jgi:outer membrane scaffolding protein for murein synthesis (MipA/OmpV family)
VGLVVRHGPAYLGSARWQTRVTPGGFLRWGRFTVTGAGGFTTRRNQDLERGLGAELLRRDGLRLQLNLRYDGGRSEADSPELAGLGSIDATVRARLVLRWEPQPGWAVGAAASTDVLGRTGGSTWDATISRRWDLTEQGHSVALGLAVSGADRRAMQAWHGVSAEQAARSGYPGFDARAGLRVVQASATYRHEFGRAWGAFIEAGMSHLLEDAARSPLTRRARAPAVGAGLAWRF